MQAITRITPLLALLMVMAAGCGRSDGPQLAPAGGTVTYQGQPLKGANVVFTPDVGPAAYASTDAEGKFQWMTQGQPGAMVGPGKVAITAFEELDQPKEEEDLTAADLKKMSTSRIPLKYGQLDASGLAATVEADAENNFSFDLTD